MAHIVGGGNGGSVLKREPCQKCNLPVFLAERLVLGKKLFHRTCLKCARCQSQLTPGSFYETEVDGEFCCETCPDEEKEFALKERLKSDVPVNEDAHKSFTEKLAMFQTDGKGFLQKSLSDEEKSKSLKRLTELYGHQDQTYKANKAFSSFIQVENHPSATSTVKSDDSVSSSDEETENENPPDLPTTKPPSPSKSDNVNDEIASSDTSQFSLTMETVNNPQSLNESPPPNRSSSTINIISDSIPIHKEMPVDAFYELANVTKEECKHDEIGDAVDCKPQIQNENYSGLVVNSMVRSRLSQFETKIGADHQIGSKNVNRKLDVNDEDDSQNVSNVQANKIEVPAADQIKLISSDVLSDIRKYEDETTQNKFFKRNVEIETGECTNEVHSDAELTQHEDVEPETLVNVSNTENDSMDRNENELDEANDVELTVSNESNSFEVKIDEIAETVVPVPRKRVSKTCRDEIEKPVPVKRGVKPKKSSKQKQIETNSTLARDVHLYPLDLNPFGSDDDNDDDINTIEVNKSIDKKPEQLSCNPFDSSDDEVELDKEDAKTYANSKDLSKSRLLFFFSIFTLLYITTLYLQNEFESVWK